MNEEDYLSFNCTVEQFVEKHLTPVYYGGKVICDYYVDKDGDVWSTKRNRLKRLNWFFNKKNGYPRVSLSTEDKKFMVLVHRLVCETFHERPLPEGVSIEEWKRTPKSVKRHFDHYWEVNHIDHVRTNYHPNNLEWVSCKQNVDRYKKFNLSRKS